MTWERLYLRAERIGQQLRSRLVGDRGQRVALVYRRTEILEYAAAMFGCFAAGCVAVPVVGIESLAELRQILDGVSASVVLSTEANVKALGRDLAGKDTGPNASGIANIDDWTSSWWRTEGIGPAKASTTILQPPKSSKSSSKTSGPESAHVGPNDLAYVEFTRSGRGEVKGVGISHRTILSQGAALKAALGGWVQAAGAPPDSLLTYIEPRQGPGLILGLLLGAYCGHTTIFLGSAAPEVPGLWVGVLTRWRVTLAVGDYPGLQHVLSSYAREPQKTQQWSKKQTPDLLLLRRLLIETPRPDAALDRDLEESLLAPLGCRAFADAVTPVCALGEHGGMILSMRDHLGQLDSASGVYRPLEIGVERRALREGRVVRVRETDGRWGDGRVVARVASFGYPMPEVAMIIVDPSTKIACPPDRVGEIWVDSPALSGGFWGLPKHTMSIFRARPSYRDEHDMVYPLDREFLRTGLMGMMVEDQVFVLGIYEDRIRQVVWTK